MRAAPGSASAAASASPAAPAAPPAGAVLVFTTPACPYCKRAKAALREQGVSFQEVDVSANASLRAQLKDVAGASSVPQVFAGGTLVGGSDALAAAIADGSFGRLLAHPPPASTLPQPLQQAVQAALQAAAASSAASQQQAGRQLNGELQQLLAKLADPRSGVRRASSGPEPHAFSGAALLDWLAANGAADRSGAAGIARQLLDANEVTLLAPSQPEAHALQRVADDPGVLYRLRAEAPRAVAWGAPLNTHFWWGPAPPRPAEVVAEDLRARILALYDKYLSADGKAVRYAALKADPAFWAYVDAAAELQRVDLAPLSRAALMAFGINLYNALVIHTLVVHGTKRYESTTGRVQFFQKAAKYRIGGADYTLDDLENGLLRGNRPPASSLGMLLKLPCLSRGPFRPGDPRARHVVSPVDARIHFALVCGAKSCPPIKLYAADSLNEGLAAAAEAFCASEVVVDAAKKKVTLSKIFSWYYTDFGDTKAARLAWLLPHLQPAPRGALQGLLAADPAAAGVRVKYAPYDWGVNAADE